MKFLVLFLLPTLSLADSIRCQGRGFFYNSTEVRTERDLILIELDSYFSKDIGSLDLKQDLKSTYDGKAKVLIKFHKSDCEINESKQLVHCSDKKRRTVTIKSSHGDSFKKKLSLNNATFDLQQIHVMKINNQGSAIREKGHIASLRLGRNHLNKVLQVSFEQGDCQ